MHETNKPFRFHRVYSIKYAVRPAGRTAEHMDENPQRYTHKRYTCLLS